MSDAVVVDRVQLPSRGRVYEGRIPDGWVTIRPMTTKEEKLLNSPRNRVEILNRLVASCIVGPEFTVDELLVTDRFFLLLCIRNFTYGPVYEMQVECPSCNFEGTKILRVPEDLVVTVLTEEDGSTFDVELPVAGKRLTLRRLTVQDERDVLKFVRAQGARVQAEEGDPSYEPKLARHIVAVDGSNVNIGEALNMIEGGQMHGADSATIRKALADNDCGADLTVTHVCIQCGTKTKLDFEFTDEFFRPGTIEIRQPAGVSSSTKGDSEGAAVDSDAD